MAAQIFEKVLPGESLIGSVYNHWAKRRAYAAASVEVAKSTSDGKSLEGILEGDGRGFGGGGGIQPQPGTRTGATAARG